MKTWSIAVIIILLLILSSCSSSSNKSRTTPNPTVAHEEKNRDICDKGKVDSTPEDNYIDDTPKEEKPLKEIKGLVRIDKLDPNFVIDLKYATSDNFTGRQIYTASVCLLRRTTAEKLIKANNEFMKTGHKIKIWDAYRPPYAQQTFWDIVKDPLYVADPKKGSSAHDTGCTVDITLVDRNGNEVVMPSGFDDFSIKASRKYTETSTEVKENLEYLTEVMRRNGFTTINSEWWEFRDTDIGEFPAVDVRLEEFLD